MAADGITRRSFLGAALPLLAACSTPLPLPSNGSGRPQSDKAAAFRLQESAEAHGQDAYRGIHDIAVSYDGRWRAFVDGIQPDIVDAAFRGSSQERLLPFEATIGQRYQGPGGGKQVAWRRRDGAPGDIKVWRNGRSDMDAEHLRAAALVAEGYGLFLLGPLWLVDRGLAVRSAGTARVGDRECDVIDVWSVPGLGQSTLDRISLYVDRDDAVCRRFRFTLEGTANTRGAVAEVDTFDHRRLAGILWPMRSYERIVHPIRLPAHDWHVTGLDVDRGFGRAEIDGPDFTGTAAAPAAPLA